MLRRIRFQAFLCGGMLIIGLLAVQASATPTGTPVGTWLTANGHGVIAIAECGNALCGRIVGIDRAATAPMPTDVHGQSQCGLTIITNERRQADGTWLGDVTDPRDGRTYQAELWLDDSGNLHVRGFIVIPLLGSTQIWRPFAGHLTTECGLA